MELRYPLTLAAAQAVESSQWGLGDALLAEIPIAEAGIHSGVSAKLEEAQKELAVNGIEYAIGSLASYRLISQHFPKELRQNDLAYKIYYDCQTPDTFEVVLARCEKDHPGQRLTSTITRKLLKQIKAEEAEKAAAEKAAAEAAAREEALKRALKAKDDVIKAEEKIKSAKNTKQREKAEADKEAAKKEAAAADQKVKDTPVPPAGPHPSSFACLVALKNASMAGLKAANEAISEATEAKVLNDEQFIVVRQKMLKTAERWNEAIKVIDASRHQVAAE